MLILIGTIRTSYALKNAVTPAGGREPGGGDVAGPAYADGGVGLVWCELSNAVRESAIAFAKAMRETHPLCRSPSTYSLSFKWSSDPAPLHPRDRWILEEREPVADALEWDARDDPEDPDRAQSAVAVVRERPAVLQPGLRRVEADVTEPADAISYSEHTQESSSRVAI